MAQVIIVPSQLPHVGGTPCNVHEAGVEIQDMRGPYGSRINHQHNVQVSLPPMPEVNFMNDYMRWYGLPGGVQTFYDSHIALRLWDFQDFRRKLETISCEVILVQRAQADNWLVAFSDFAGERQFIDWFSAQERKTRVDVAKRYGTQGDDIFKWLNSVVSGRYTMVNSQTGFTVHIENPDDAFAFKMRWSLPVDHTEEA